MKCEEFELIGLELRSEEADCDGRAAAIEHVANCARCAALLESWGQARVELEALREATENVETPARVEMRLRQEFRTKHHTLKMRRRVIFVGWTLATAAVLVAFVSWWNWRGTQRHDIAAHTTGSAAIVATASGNSGAGSSQDADDSMLVADNGNDFTLLPDSLPQETQNAAILRVRMQRGALADLGLPVNEERASDWVQVDLLVGEDGQPRAVRFPSEANN